MPKYERPYRVVIEDDSGKTHDAEVHGFADSGIWVRWTSPTLLPFRADLHLTFDIPGAHDLSVNGTVVYSTAEGAGFEIKDPAFAPILQAWSFGQTADIPVDIVPRRPERTSAAEDLDTVLIVEDDPSIAMMLQIALSKAGIHCVLTRDVKAGRAVLEKKEVKAILLDWMLPGESGDVLLQEVRTKQPGVPVAVISGVVSHQTTRQTIMGRGASAIFSKPFSITEVVRWVRLHVRTPTQRTGSVEKLPGKVR